MRNLFTTPKQDKYWVTGFTWMSRGKRNRLWPLQFKGSFVCLRHKIEAKEKTIRSKYFSDMSGNFRKPLQVTRHGVWKKRVWEKHHGKRFWAKCAFCSNGHVNPIGMRFIVKEADRTDYHDMPAPCNLQVICCDCNRDRQEHVKHSLNLQPLNAKRAKVWLRTYGNVYESNRRKTRHRKILLLQFITRSEFWAIFVRMFTPCFLQPTRGTYHTVGQKNQVA